nr:hypothetical protein CFP56_74948 [Quercus suber]
MSYSGGQQISHYEYGPPALCGKTFADANATGIVYINPNVVQSPQSGQPDNGSGLTQNSAWALTIQNAYGAPNAASELSASVGAWYDTNGANYADDIHLGYDVCALALGFANPYAVYRGQSDNGTCLATFDAPCINALKTAASTYAEWLVGGNHGTQTNITDTSLPLICNDIATMIAANIPEECSAYFDEPLAIGGPLTTVDDDYAVFLNDSCRINGTFQNVLNFSTNSSLPVYTNETELIVPIMTVFMPIANQNLIATISQAVTELTCLHINTINPGSYVPPPMAEVASPNSSDSNGLSGGAIAGIAIGVVLAIALLGGLAFWFWRRRRANRQGGSGSAWRPMNQADAKELAGIHVAAAPDDGARYEFPAEPTKRYELGSMDPKRANELEGKTRYELADLNADRQAQKQLHYTTAIFETRKLSQLAAQSYRLSSAAASSHREHHAHGNAVQQLRNNASPSAGSPTRHSASISLIPFSPQQFQIPPQTDLPAAT